MVADSLSFTSALSVALAVVFLVITVGITVVKLFNGSIAMPRLLPDVTDVSSFFKLFTVVPVLVTAYICHYNGMETVCLFTYIEFISLELGPCFCNIRMRNFRSICMFALQFLSSLFPC